MPISVDAAREINANGGVTLTGPNGTVSNIFVADIGPNMDPTNMHNGRTTAPSINRGVDFSPALMTAIGGVTDHTVQIKYNSGGAALAFSANPTAAQRQQLGQR